MHNIVKSVIESGRFELSDILKKIDTQWLQGSITDDEKAELVALAQGGAKVENSVDIIAKITNLEQRVKALEEGKTAGGEAEEYADFIVAKWYYAGDKITFNGKQYICIAPVGQVCTWSPADYPTYWQEA